MIAKVMFGTSGAVLDISYLPNSSAGFETNVRYQTFAMADLIRDPVTLTFDRLNETSELFMDPSQLTATAGTGGGVKLAGFYGVMVWVVDSTASIANLNVEYIVRAEAIPQTASNYPINAAPVDPAAMALLYTIPNTVPYALPESKVEEWMNKVGRAIKGVMRRYVDPIRMIVKGVDGLLM